MKLFQTTALGLALALGTTAIVAIQPADAAKKEAAKAPKYSEAIQKNIPVAQKALDAGQFAAVKTSIAAAQAGAQTPDDKYVVGATTLNLGIKTNDVATQSAGIDMMIDSGAAPADQMIKLLDNQGRLAVQARNYAKADTAFTKLMQLDPTNSDNISLLAEVKIQNKQPNEALPLIQQAIAAKKAANQPITEDWYKRAFAIAYNAKNAQASNQMGLALVQAFPTPTNWRDTLQVYRELNAPDTQTDLDLYRLQRAAKALKGERDFYDYANSAYDKGLPGESVAVITEGTSSNMVSSSRALTEVK